MLVRDLIEGDLFVYGWRERQWSELILNVIHFPGSVSNTRLRVLLSTNEGAHINEHTLSSGDTIVSFIPDTGDVRLTILRESRPIFVFPAEAVAPVTHAIQ